MQGYLGNMSPMCQISVSGLFWIASCTRQIEERHPWHRRYISIVWPFLVWIKLVWDIIYTLLSWDLFQCLILDELQCLYSSPTTAGSSESPVEENDKNTAPSEFLLIFLTDRTIKNPLLLFTMATKQYNPFFCSGTQMHWVCSRWPWAGEWRWDRGCWIDLKECFFHHNWLRVLGVNLV